MKVFVYYEHWRDGKQFDEWEQIKLFHNKEKAQKYMNECFASAEKDFINAYDSDIERSCRDGYFYLIGSEYYEDYCTARITEQEIE